MSGIGGVWLESDVRAPDMLGALHGALARRGDGDGDVMWRPPIGMVYRPPAARAARADANQPANARQPWIARSGLAVCWDGRLDNRAELARELALGDGEARDDLHVIATGFERRGARWLARLVGDWALAIWDPRRRALTLARDPFGVRPLFFCHRPGLGVGGAVWASTLEAVRATGAPSDELDAEWLAGYFTSSIAPGCTPYRDVRAVPPGTAVTIERDRVRETRLWRLIDGLTGGLTGGLTATSAPHRDDRDVEREFAALFRQAVARRVPEGEPVGVELSGGLDSSSIACAAREALAGAGRTNALLPVSVVYAHSRMGDERRFIRAVESHIATPSHYVWQEQWPVLADMHTPRYEFPSTAECIKAREQAITRYLRARGATVLLRGSGGDQLLCSELGAAVELGDLLRAGRIRELWSTLRARGGASPLPYWQLGVQGAVYPLLPRWLRMRIGAEATEIPAWVDARFARRMNLRERLFWDRDVPREIALPSARMRYADLQDCIDLTAWSYDRGPEFLELSYPFLDRTLVEFCLALPLDQLVRAAQTRSVQRRALRGLVPGVVLDRRGKATMQEALLSGLERAWHELAPVVTDLRVADMGLVDGSAFATAMRRARYGGEVNASLLVLVLSLEFWLRAREREPLPAAARAADPVVRGAQACDASR